MITVIGSPRNVVFVANQETATERADESFKFICRNILGYGSFDNDPRPKYSDGTPAHTYSVNHVVQMFDLNNGDFPLISLRNIAVKSAIGEILWIYKDQSTYLKKLAEYGVTWWDEWDIGDGTIGQCYGKTVKDHKIIDDLIENLKNDPDSRRHIIDLYQYVILRRSMDLGLVHSSVNTTFVTKKTEIIWMLFCFYVVLTSSWQELSIRFSTSLYS